MDLGLYNKRVEPRGEHGTLIGNWVEERSLQQATGFARYEDLAIEKKALNQTQHRIVSHSAQPTYGGCVSISRSTYVDHGTEATLPKIFNQTGSHWQHDEGLIKSMKSSKDMRSQLSFGSEPTFYSTTQGSSFAQAIHAPYGPLQSTMRSTTPFAPRQFPAANATGVGANYSKLDRPHTGQ